MGSAFRPLPSLIETDLAWREPNVKVLRHPAGHEPQDSRILFHETVHYWQHLTGGFLALMVEEDWLRLEAFEADGTRSAPGATRIAFVQENATCGFSARDLQESLARFWDVHVIGPHVLLELEFQDPRRRFDDFFKEQYFALKAKGAIVHPIHGGYSNIAFDMAMDGAAGNYAMPYQSVQKRFSPAVSGTVFPLAGHFALQTRNPVEVFLLLAERAAPYLQQVPPGLSIHDLWKAGYPLVRNLALQVANELGVGSLILTPALIQKGPLRRHPVYAWMFRELEIARKLLQESTLANELAKGFGKVPDDIKGILALDFAVACCGDTACRSFLIEWLAPPCVRFPDGRRWLLPELHRRELVPVVDEAEQMLSDSRVRAADDVLDVHRRWQLFLKSKRPTSQ